VSVVALLAATGSSKALVLIVAGVAGVFTGLSLRSWRERRKK
jgi:LPXTG-motif cell wall-anchored protein